MLMYPDYYWNIVDWTLNNQQSINHLTFEVIILEFIHQILGQISTRGPSQADGAVPANLFPKAAL